MIFSSDELFHRLHAAHRPEIWPKTVSAAIQVEDPHSVEAVFPCPNDHTVGERYVPSCAAEVWVLPRVKC